MNPHLKLAYDHGVQQAFVDAGLVKESDFGAAPRTMSEDFDEIPEGRLGSRLGHIGAGALLGTGLGGLAGVAAIEAPLKYLSGVRDLRNLARPGIPAAIFGAMGALAGGVRGQLASQRGDDFSDKLLREIRSVPKTLGRGDLSLGERLDILASSDLGELGERAQRRAARS